MLLDTSRWLLRGVAHSSEQCCLVCPKLQLLARIGSAVTNAVCAKDLWDWDRLGSDCEKQLRQSSPRAMNSWHDTIPCHVGTRCGGNPHESNRSRTAPWKWLGAGKDLLDSDGRMLGRPADMPLC